VGKGRDRWRRQIHRGKKKREQQKRSQNELTGNRQRPGAKSSLSEMKEEKKKTGHGLNFKFFFDRYHVAIVHPTNSQGF
jgi:hypothetical protein